MRVFWNPSRLQGHFVRTIAATVLVHLERVALPEAADLVLYPFDVRDSLASLPRVVEHAEAARRIGGRLLVFQVSDTTVPLPVPNTVVFRTSLKRSRRLPHEHLLPYVWDSIPAGLLEELRRPPPGESTVGFCGCPSTHPIRQRIVRNLPALLPCRFILRDRFWAGKPHDRTVVREFFENILATDLTLAVRGAGNFSHRFYQTLSCGRTPLFIDTDCLLPYEGLEPLPWEEILVKVDVTRLDEIVPAVERFHARTRGDDSLASRLESLHRKYLTPTGLAEHLVRHREHYLA